LALEQQTLEHLADVERGKVRVMRAQRDVFQVEEHSHRGVRILRTHQAMMLATSRSRDSENWTSNFHSDSFGQRETTRHDGRAGHLCG
jgi:hypothetical protein